MFRMISILAVVLILGLLSVVALRGVSSPGCTTDPGATTTTLVAGLSPGVNAAAQGC